MRRGFGLHQGWRVRSAWIGRRSYRADVARSRRGQPASHEEAVPKSCAVNTGSERLLVGYLLGHVAGIVVEAYGQKRVVNGLQQW